MPKTLLQLPATKEHGALLITAEVKNKVAELTIDGYIHSWADASAKNLKNEITKLKGEGASTAKLHINTEGGNCFQANQMVNHLDEAFGPENVSVSVGALAASAGSYIVAKYNLRASGKTNSQYMIHPPSGVLRGTAKQVKKEVKLLENMEAMYISEYARAFNLTDAEVEALWADGDHWMNAAEALKIGLISSIEETDAPITAHTKMQLVAAAAPVIPAEPTPIITNPKPINMNTEVMAMSIGLPKDATEAQIEAKIAQLKKQADTATDLQAKLDQQEKDGKAAKITAMLDTAEAAKKFTGDQRANLQAMAEASLEATEKFIEAMLPVEAIAVTPDAKAPGATGADPDTKAWKYEDYANAGAKGTDLLAALEENDPAAYAALISEAMPEPNPVANH